MRYSVVTGDPGYKNWIRTGKRVRVFIEGVQRNNVVTADEELRMAVVTALDKNGQPQLNAEKTEVLHETIYGDVRVEH